MKKYTLLSIVPLLGLLAVSCSSPNAMQSTEYDDMYYSSSDKTEYVQEQQVQQQTPRDNRPEEALAEGEVLNPEYSSRNAATYADDDYDEYYDGRAYNPRDNWYQPNYSFVDPYWGAAYAPRMTSYAYYDPFYDPFFNDPFYYSSFNRNPYWNRGLSVNISYGMGWGGGNFHNRPYYSNWWPGSYGYNMYNGYRQGYYHGFHNGFYAGNPYSAYYDRPVIVRNPVQVQNRPRDSRSAVVTNRPASAGRPERENVREGEGSVGRQTVGRPSRSGETVTSPTNTQESRATLPARPRRTENSNESRTTREPANTNRQEQREVTPRRTERRSAPAPEYRQPQQQERRQPQRERTRTIESRPTRTEESRPARTYESSPSRSYESSSPAPSRQSSGSSSGGGGRPVRGQ